jgi:hypothetical protein
MNRELEKQFKEGSGLDAREDFNEFEVHTIAYINWLEAIVLKPKEDTVTLTDGAKGDTLIVNTHRIVRKGFELKEDVVEDRKAIPVFSGVLAYFPDALKEVAKASYAATKQHHPDKDMFWDRTKSTDHRDSLGRHLIDHTKNPIDTDGVLHLAKVAWRSLAALQIYLENK